MAYSEALAERIRTALKGTKLLTEKKMFGGICFLVGGRMAAGVSEDKLMLRLGNEATALALKQPQTKPMDFTGRILKSMLWVEPAGYKTPAQLNGWLHQAVACAQAEGPKPAARKARRAKA